MIPRQLISPNLYKRADRGSIEGLASWLFEFTFLETTGATTTKQKVGTDPRVVSVPHDERIPLD